MNVEVFLSLCYKEKFDSSQSQSYFQDNSQ